MQHSFSEVLEHFGGITGLANALGVTTQAISQWEEEIPEGRAYQIEVLSKGKYKAAQLPVRKSEVRLSRRDAPLARA
jgi:hypothetical protein